MMRACPDFCYLQRLDGVSSGGVCFAGTGVLVEFVVSRFMAGESLAELAEDYALSVQMIEAGIRLLLLVHGTSLTSKRAEMTITQYIPYK